VGRSRDQNGGGDDHSCEAYPSAGRGIWESRGG